MGTGRKGTKPQNSTSWVGRELQVSLLQSYVATVKRQWRRQAHIKDSIPLPTISDALYLQGAPATGKSVVLDGILSSHRSWLDVVHLDCVSFENDRSAYTRILNAVTDGVMPLPAVLRLDDLVRIISTVHSWRGQKAIAIVFDRAEWLRKRLTPGALSALQSLTSVVGVPGIVPIFVSEAPWDPLRDQQDSPQATVVAFPSYKLDEAQQIVSSIVLANLGPDEDPVSVRQILDHIVDMLFHGCTDIRELVRVAQNLYRHPNYANRVNCALSNLYHADINGASESIKSRDAAFVNELPTLGQLLLLGSYLASRNEARFDAKYFTKARTKKKRTLSKSKVLSGIVKRKPIVFGLDRLIAIAGHLLRDYELSGASRHRPIKPLRAMKGHTMTQVVSLVQRRHLAMKGNSLDEPTFVCHLDDESAKQLARLLDIRLEMYAHVDE